jgi:hypothetical protein
MKIGFNRNIPIGQTIYDHDYNALQYSTCLWCFYPIFRLVAILKNLRLCIYKYLNSKGIMQTPQGCCAQFKNLRIKEWLCAKRRKHAT